MPNLIDTLEPQTNARNVSLATIDRESAIAGFASDATPRPVDSGYFLQILAVGIPLWLGDVVACALSVAVGLSIANILTSVPHHGVAFTAFTVMAYSICFWSVGLYPGAGLHPARELKHQFRAVLTGTMALAAALLLVSSWRSPYVIALGISFVILLVLLPLCRGIIKSLLRLRGIGLPFYFLGRREDVLRVYRDMTRFGWTMLRPAGRFCGPEGNWGAVDRDISTEFEWKFERDVAYRGTPELLIESAIKNKVYRLFIVGDNAAETVAANSKIFSVFPEVVCTRASRSHFCASSAFVNCGLMSGVKIEESLLLPWPKFIKRSMDVVFSGLALLLLSPVLACIAILIKLTSPGPVTFSHSRIGRGGRTFKAHKFRSMVPDANKVLADYLDKHPELRAEWERDHKLKDDPRITWIGKLIRKTSLDELPQLWNVFVGEMSLVGPRPIVDEEIAKYGLTFREYLRVTPGITGLWQISGRNNTTYAERLAFDEFYVRNWSPWLDIYILFRTVRTVLFCEGAY